MCGDITTKHDFKVWCVGAGELAEGVKSTCYFCRGPKFDSQPQQTSKAPKSS